MIERARERAGALLVVLTAVGALGTFANPATAFAAGWTDTMGGVTKNLVKGENPHMVYNGSFTFLDSNIGGVSCPEVESTIKLTGGTNEADIETFKILNTESCHASGFLKAVCGTNSVTKHTLLSKPVMKISGATEATISTFELELALGATCPKLVLKSDAMHDMSLKTNADTKFTTGSLSGTLDDGGAEPAVVSGAGSLTPVNTFGISFP